MPGAHMNILDTMTVDMPSTGSNRYLSDILLGLTHARGTHEYPGYDDGGYALLRRLLAGAHCPSLGVR